MDELIKPEPQTPTVITEPLIKKEQMFQKDPTPILPVSPRKNLIPSKKILFIIGLIVLVLIGGIVYGYTNRNKPDSLSDKATQSEVDATNEQGANLDSTNQTNSTESTPGTSTETSTALVNSDQPTAPTAPSTSPTTTNTTTNPSAQTPKTYDISYTNNCYSPANLTIKKGDTVRFTNNSNRGMWPASSNHPSHLIYPEFDSKTTISIGKSYSFTFTKVGVWGYHDHEKPGCTGTITVQ